MAVDRVSWFDLFGLTGCEGLTSWMSGVLDLSSGCGMWDVSICVRRLFDLPEFEGDALFWRAG